MAGVKGKSGGARIGAGRKKNLAGSYQALKCKGEGGLFAFLKKTEKKRPATCDHAKPRFSNGKERKVCFDCAPKPEPKPRKAHTYKAAVRALCAACSTAFDKRMDRERFCSDQCREATNARAGAERRRDNSARQCGHCKALYVPPYGSRLVAYCSQVCRRKALNLSTGGNTHRRRAKRYGCEYQPVNRRKVFERDGWKCYLCGIDTPAELSGKRMPNSPELDHVVALSKGGAHSYANTRCACRSCNGLKNDRAANDFMDWLAA